MLAGTGGLHRGVQRQQVGLEGNVVDGRDDRGDLLVGGVNLLHGLLGLGRHVAGLAGLAGHPVGHAARLLGIVGGLAHRGGDLLHARGRLHQRGRLLLGALGQVLVALGDLAAGHLHRERALADIAHQLLGVGRGGVEGAVEPRQLVAARHRQAAGQVAAAALDVVQGRTQRAYDALYHQHREEDGQAGGDQRDHQVADQLLAGFPPQSRGLVQHALGHRILQGLELVDLGGLPVEPLLGVDVVAAGDAAFQGDLAQRQDALDLLAAQDLRQPVAHLGVGQGLEALQVGSLLAEHRQQPLVGGGAHQVGAEGVGQQGPLDPRQVLGLEQGEVGAEAARDAGIGGQVRHAADHAHQGVVEAGVVGHRLLRPGLEALHLLADGGGIRQALLDVRGLAGQLRVQRGQVGTGQRLAKVADGPVGGGALGAQPVAEHLATAADEARGHAPLPLQLMDQVAGMAGQGRQGFQPGHVGGEALALEDAATGEPGECQER